MLKRLNIVIGLWLILYNFIESFNRDIATTTTVTGHSGQSKMVDSNAETIATAVTRITTRELEPTVWSTGKKAGSVESLSLNGRVNESLF